MPQQTEFFVSAIRTFKSQKSLVERAIGQLKDDQLRQPLDENTNSIAVIMKHIAGNLRSRFTDFLTTDGEKSWRDRDDEFVDSFQSREELLEHWQGGWDCLLSTLESLSPADMEKEIEIRGEPHSLPLAIHRSLGHIGYHTGQIVMIARILAKDHWETLTIARGGSQQYNREKWKSV